MQKLMVLRPLDPNHTLKGNKLQLVEMILMQKVIILQLVEVILMQKVKILQLVEKLLMLKVG